MQPNDTGDVIEAVVVTFLCSAVCMVIQWFGKNYMDMVEPAHEIHFHTGKKKRKKKSKELEE